MGVQDHVPGLQSPSEPPHLRSWDLTDTSRPEEWILIDLAETDRARSSSKGNKRKKKPKPRLQCRRTAAAKWRKYTIFFTIAKGKFYVIERRKNKKQKGGNLFAPPDLPKPREVGRHCFASRDAVPSCRIRLSPGWPLSQRRAPVINTYQFSTALDCT